jgi:hypothetical protein
MDYVFVLEPPMRRLPSPGGPRPNTIPKSPFMALKSRVRVEHIPSQADKEKEELEEMKKYYFILEGN